MIRLLTELHCGWESVVLPLSQDKQEPQGSSLQTPVQDVPMAPAASVKITHCSSPFLTDRDYQPACKRQDVTAWQKESCHQAVSHWGRRYQPNTMIKATQKAKKRAPNSDCGEESSSHDYEFKLRHQPQKFSLLCSSSLPQSHSSAWKQTALKGGQPQPNLEKYRRRSRTGRGQKVPPPCLRGLAASLFPRQTTQDDLWKRREASLNIGICLQ